MNSISRGPGRATGSAWRIPAVVVSLLLLAGCATGPGYSGQGPGVGQTYPGTPYPGAGYPDQTYPGQPYPGQTYPGQTHPGQAYPGGQYGGQGITGSVERIDQNGQRLVLVTQDGGYGRATTREVLIDRSTRLFYQGQEYPVQGLERGDVVQVQVAQSGGRLWARTIEVVRNVRDGYGDPYGNPPYGSGQRDPYGNDPYRNDPYGNDPRNQPYPSDPYRDAPLANDARGTVSYVDPRSRIVHLAPGASRSGLAQPGQGLQVRYDQDTRAEFEGRSFDPAQLLRGDEVVVQARAAGGGTLVAERIVVQRRGR